MFLLNIYWQRAAEAAVQKGDLTKIKKAVSNLLILASPGGTRTICTREKLLKIWVPRLTKISFLIHLLFKFVAKPNQPFSLNIWKVIALRCIIDASTETILGAIPKVCTQKLPKRIIFYSLIRTCTHMYFFGKFCVCALWMAL